MQVRDHALQIQDDLPRQGANRDYYIQNQERELALTDGTTPGGALAKITDSGWSIFNILIFLVRMVSGFKLRALYLFILEKKLLI